MGHSVKRSSKVAFGILVGLAMAGCVSDTSSRRVARAALPVVFAPSREVVQPVPAPRIVSAPAALLALVPSLTRDFGGKVGIAIRSIDDGWTVESNGDIKLPQQSVSKLWVAMSLLDARDAGKLSLDDEITVRKEDLTLFNQPIAALVKGDEGYKTTVRELLERAMTQSDNTANDRLLRYIGGPTVVRAFLAKKAIADIRFGPGERLLQSLTAGLEWKPEYSTGKAFEAARSKIPASTRMDAFEKYIADPVDGAAPRAIVTALTRLKKGELLSPASTKYLLGVMESSRTGKARLRGAVPEGWTFGHKTGTGQNFSGRTAGYNDVGILIAPNGKSYAIAVMIGDTPKPIPERQQLMQAVVLAVVTNHRW